MNDVGHDDLNANIEPNQLTPEQEVRVHAALEVLVRYLLGDLDLNALTDTTIREGDSQTNLDPMQPSYYAKQTSP